jgi:hypothetical protein
MNEISNLIKEAKPLYLKEKRNKRNAKIALCSFLTMFLFGASIFTAVDINSQNIIAQYNVSPIEEMGFAVDEYGFLMVE